MKTKASWTDAATFVIVCCAVMVTFILVRREFFRPVATARGTTTVVPDWETYASSGHTLGDSSALATIVLFADFECPYCRRFAFMADSLRAAGKRFKLVYRHFPLGRHRFAIPAVRASECAAAQGRFKEMHDVLYANADSFGLASWWWFAQKAGVVDSIGFSDCVSSTIPILALHRDTTAGNRLRVTGTPFFLFGKLGVRGLHPADSVAAYLDRAF